MLAKNRMLIGALAGALIATPVLAAGNDCLQHNRLVSWRALDENTLLLTDRFMHEYTVQMANRCQGATIAGARLVYDTWENLSCLMPGMIVHVVAPGLVRSSCSIASVHAGAPGPSHG